MENSENLDLSTKLSTTDNDEKDIQILRSKVSWFESLSPKQLMQLALQKMKEHKDGKQKE